MDFNKIRQILLSFSIALTVTIIFQYFFQNTQKQTEEVESGRSRVAPKFAAINRPLNLEIDFDDKKVDLEEKINVIQTDHAKFEFTNYGAAIRNAEFKHLNNTEHIFKTFQAQGREDLCFLIALDQETPFYYQLISQNENDNTFELSYQTSISQGKLNKKFIIYKHQYKIDLVVEVQFSQTKEPLRLRILYPSPSISEIKGDVFKVFIMSANLL